MSHNNTAVPVLRFDPQLSDPSVGLFGSGLGVAGMNAPAHAMPPAAHDRTPAAFRSGMIVVACDHGGRFAAVALVKTEGRQVHQGRVEVRNAKPQYVPPTLIVLRAGQAVCPQCTVTYAVSPAAVAHDAAEDPPCGVCAAKLGRPG